MKAGGTSSGAPEPGSGPIGATASGAGIGRRLEPLGARHLENSGSPVSEGTTGCSSVRRSGRPPRIPGKMSGLIPNGDAGSAGATPCAGRPPKMPGKTSGLIPNGDAGSAGASVDGGAAVGAGSVSTDGALSSRAGSPGGNAPTCASTGNPASTARTPALKGPTRGFANAAAAGQLGGRSSSAASRACSHYRSNTNTSRNARSNPPAPYLEGS